LQDIYWFPTLSILIAMKKNTAFLLFSFLLSAAIATAQNRVYVAAGATGLQNGTSWANAYNNLQTAIDMSSSLDTLWVKNGSYKPSKALGNSTDARSKSFQLKSNVFIYGGFVGNEISIAQRTGQNQTVLSGDLGLVQDTSDNAYHVLVGLNTVGILDRIEVAFGAAHGSGTDIVSGFVLERSLGGGVYLDSANIVFNNCYVHSNFAKSGAGFYTYKSTTDIQNSEVSANIANGSDDNVGGGGGMFNVNSTANSSYSEFSLNISSGLQGGGAIRNESSNGQYNNVNFYNNTCTDGDGGGAMYNLDSDPDLNWVNFTSNTTNKEAGAMYNDGSIATISNATFTNNSSDNGGAMENDGGSDVVLNRILFTGNSSAGDGGAIHNWKSNIELTDVIFFQNVAVGDGGAIKNYNQCSPTITNCTFQENEAGGNGGAFFNERDSHPIITNTLFAKNKAGAKGGGFYNKAGATPSSPIFTNVTIANNSAVQSGGGAFDDGLGASKLRNSIVYGNIAPAFEDIEAPISSVATAVFNDIIGNELYEDGFTAPTTFTALVFLDSANNDYRLAATSPAIDFGDSSFYATSATPNLSAIITDIRGAARIMGNNVDVGAFEKCNFSVTPTVSLAHSPSFPVLKDSLVTFTATATNQGASPTYAWSINGSLVAVTSVPVFTAIADVDFFKGDVIKVELHSSIACKTGNPSDSVIANVTAFGLVDLDKGDNFLQVFPNPNHGFFTVKAATIVGENYTIVITDLRGNSVSERTASASGNMMEIEIDLGKKLARGVYLLSLNNTREFNKVVRFIVL